MPPCRPISATAPRARTRLSGPDGPWGRLFARSSAASRSSPCSPRRCSPSGGRSGPLTPSRVTSGPALLQPSARPRHRARRGATLRHPAALGRRADRLPGRSRRLLHAEVDWKPCADGSAISAAPSRCRSTTRTPAASASPSPCARCRRATLQTARLARHQPGRPRGSGVQYAQLSSFAFTPELRAAYDIVGFDPRGIGESSPVRCLTRRRHGPSLQRRPDARHGRRAR